MSRVRLLVGTKKGAFICTSDGKRKKWNIEGPYFAGWEIYHMKGSPVDPNRIYASQTSGWFGQVIQRSDDGGKTWFQPGTPAGEPTTTPEGMPKGESNKFVYDTSAENRQAADDASVVRWHAASVGIQARVAFGAVADRSRHCLCRRGRCRAVSLRPMAARRGTNWPGLRGHGTGPKWSPGAGGMGLHTILLDPKNPKRIYIAISAAGAFRTDDGGKTWKPINEGLRNDYLPDPTPEVGFCVHDMVLHPSRPDTLFMQLHGGGGILRSDNAGDQWKVVRGNLPTDFGFPIDVHRPRARNHLLRSHGANAGPHSAGRQAARLPQPHRRQRMGTAHQGPAARELLCERAARSNVGRFARSVRSLFRHNRRPGVRFGRCRRQLESPSPNICRRCFQSKRKRWRK